MTQGGDTTLEYVTLEKFSGLNLSQPSGAFGQPNVLDNIYLDRRGGYVTAPGNVAIKTFAGSTLTALLPFSGSNIVAAVFGAGPNKLSFLKLSTGAVLYSTATTYPSIASYKSGLMVAWNYGQVDGGIQVYSADYAMSTDPVILVTEVNKKTPLTISLVESGGYGTAPSGSAAYSYSGGGLSGFNPNRTYYLFLYIQDGPDPGTSSSGTTLNPAPPKPKRIIPVVYQIKGQIGGLTKEFKVVINNPTHLQIFAYAEATLTKRPFEEWYNNDLHRINNQAFAAGKTTDYPIWDTTGNGGSFYRFQALNSGTTGATPPDLKQIPIAFNSRFIDGDVEFVCLGRTDDVDNTFRVHLGKVGKAPLQYAQPDVVVPEFDRIIYQDFAQLYTQEVGDTTEVYRSAKEKPDNFIPASFFPLGSITETHLNRTWVVADSVWRTYATANFNVAAYVDITFSTWEQAKRRRTVYYSEPDTNYSFLERFIVLPLGKSANIVAMHSLGDYLIFLGEADAAVLSGDSEANFYVRGLDIPGGYRQDLGVVVNGVLYYRGVGGIYRLNGGSAERISDDVAPLIPDALGANEAVSRDDTHIQFQISSALTLVYDTISNGWTTLSAQTKFVNAGELSVNISSDTVYTMTGAPTQPATIGYTGMELGSKLRRLTVRSAAVYFDSAGGTVDFKIQAHTQKGLGVQSPGHPRLVNQTGQFCQWRFRDIQGQSFDMTIRIVPGGNEVVVKPGISIEVYKGEQLRRGYDG